MSKPRVFFNTPCIKCSEVDVEMVIVGAIVFCNSCFIEVFSTDNPAVKERKEYLKWLNIYIMKEEVK